MKQSYYPLKNEFNSDFLIENRIVHYSYICDEINSLFPYKSPINGLQELAQYSKSKLQFIDLAPELAEDNRYIFSAKINNRTFTKVEAYKLKDAKTGAAFLAWKLLIMDKLNEFDCLILSSNEIPAIIELLTHREYFVQVLKDPLVLTGKKIIASIVKQEDNPSDLCVVAFGTGNRCIQGCNLSMDGNVVNDSHAEIITRRAFVRYLYTEIEAFYSNKNSIFKMSSSGDILELKKGITFHLFISCSPCGDASVFTKFLRNAESVATTDDFLNFSKKVQGLLRSKIEAGEGDIPILTDEVHTFLGFLFGKRLRTMSCSDKVLKWNMLGLQGCLLTYFIRPIYLTFIIIGENFQEQHLTRAIYKRILTDDTISLIAKLPRGFIVNKPQIFYSNVTLNCQYDSEKSSAWSTVWFKGLIKAEVYDGTTGVFLKRSSLEVGSPCISKLSIYGAFKRLCLLTNVNLLFSSHILNSKIIIRDSDKNKKPTKSLLARCSDNTNSGFDHDLNNGELDITRYLKKQNVRCKDDASNMENTMNLSNALFSDKDSIFESTDSKHSLNSSLNGSILINSRSNELNETLSLGTNKEYTPNIEMRNSLSNINELSAKKVEKYNSGKTRDIPQILANQFSRANCLTVNRVEYSIDSTLTDNKCDSFNDTFEGKDMSMTYGEVKTRLSKYGAAMTIFKECVKKSGCGCWLSKPEEIDYFS